MSVVGGAAGGEGEGAAGCNDKNKNPTIECGELFPKRYLSKAQGLKGHQKMRENYS